MQYKYSMDVILNLMSGLGSYRYQPENMFRRHMTPKTVAVYRKMELNLEVKECILNIQIY